jgi:DNA (cytosine-5)-methyltransferase 1
VKLLAAEYFAGIGLVRMGLENCGWEVIFANDISEKKFEMYNAFFPRSRRHYVIGDIFGLNPIKIPQTQLATCSFPCIDLSLAGNMNGIEGKHSSAFWGFIKILKAQGETAPPIIMVENVPGWLHSNKGADFRVTVKALNDLGYSCDVFTLDALRFTAQSRLRVFLIGRKTSGESNDVEFILSRSKSLLPNSLRKSIFTNLDLDWFYFPIPEPPKLKTEGLSLIVEPLDEDDERWWKESEVKRHLAMMDRSHYDRVIELINKEFYSYRTFFRRRRSNFQRAEVRDDDLSGCLRTAIGGSGKQFLIKVGRGKIQMRAMTPREYARLQGVPDKFPIYVDGVQALTGFGDAVCVPVISWIAENVLNPLVKDFQTDMMNNIRDHAR